MPDVVADVVPGVGQRRLGGMDLGGQSARTGLDPQRLQRGHALRGRRHLDDLDTSIVQAQRLDPGRRERGEVGLRLRSRP